MMQNLNNDQVPNPNAALNMGDELEVRALEQAGNGYFLAVPVIQANAKLARDSGKASFGLKQEPSSLSPG